MKTQYFAKIASLALIVLLGALPASAISDFQYNGTTSDGQWQFSWVTEERETAGQMQFKDITNPSGSSGNITNVFTAVSNATYSTSDGRSYVKFPPVGSNLSGRTLRFRARAQYEVCTLWGGGDFAAYFCRTWGAAYTDWASMDLGVL